LGVGFVEKRRSTEERKKKREREEEMREGERKGDLI